MKIYQVGGAVRDRLLKRPAGDADYTVTGVTRGDLEARGWRPVGNAYEVFLHPETGEEYTLADSIEEDLLRRDLTINAMALDGETLIDPAGGVRDLEGRRLRHVRPENLFEDPLRLYRIARFSAVLPEFSVDPETVVLLRQVSVTRSFRELPGERILAELTKALAAPAPRNFFELLRAVGSEAVHFGELNIPDLDFLDRVRDLTPDTVARFAALVCAADPEKLPGLIDRLHVPNAWAREALLISRHFARARRLAAALAEDVVAFFYDIDAWRRPRSVEIFSLLLRAAGEESLGRALPRWFRETAALTKPRARAVGPELGAALRRERTALLAEVRGSETDDGGSR